MLKIYVHGNTESGFLNLDPSARLDMEELTTLFDEDMSTGEFSLPFDGITWTDNNRRLLNHAERIDHIVNKSEFLITVYDDDFPEIVKGKLTLLGRTGKFNYRNGKFSATISGSKGMFGSVIKGKTLKDLSFESIDFGTDDSREWAKKFMAGDFPQWQHLLSFSPVAIENFFDTDRGDYSGEFIAKDTVNNVIIKDSVWFFGRPKSDEPNDPAVSGTLEYLDYRTVPFLRLKNIVRKCFTDFGYYVKGDYVDTAHFEELVLFNNYSLEKYNLAANTDENRTLNPVHHLPPVPIAEFLKAVFTFLNIKLDFEGGGAALVFRKNYLANRTFKNIDDVVLDDFESQHQEAELKKGYTINYTWDSNDAYYSDRVKDISNKTIAATVAIYSDLLTLDIGRSFTTDDLVLVEAENMYYQPADATVLPVVKWDAWAERLHEYKSAEGEDVKELLMSTLSQYVYFDEVQGVTLPARYLGTRQKGSYINNKGSLVQNEYGLRVFYSRFITPFGSSVARPASLNHNRDTRNNLALFFHSLSLLGSGGLIEDMHQEWQSARRKSEIIKVDIKGDRNHLLEVKNNNTIILQSRRFLLQKVERTIPLGSSVKLFLVEL